MKGRRDEGTKGRRRRGLSWWWVVAALGYSAGILVLDGVHADPQIVNPQSSIDNGDERLFGVGARPFIFFATSRGGTPGKPHWDDLAWLLNPENLWKLKLYNIGYVAFWGNNYYTNGVTPENDGYHYIDPRMPAVFAAVRDLAGCKILGYVHGDRWREAGLTPFQLLDMADALGWNGAVFDNANVGRNADETMDFLIRWKARGNTFVHHCSVEPRRGHVMYRGAYAALEDYTLWGETNEPPVDLADPLWRHRISQVDRSQAIGMYKPRKDSAWRDLREKWYPKLPPLRCVARVGSGEGWEAFVKWYYPAWKRWAAIYRSDRDAFNAYAREVRR